MTLGKLHRHWLRRLSASGRRMGVRYGSGPRMNALQGLIDAGYVRLVIGFESLGLVEMTEMGNSIMEETV